ncbi:ABC transporter permease [Undibacterium sp. Jales W-56]|uniref:ABC transporter permease n=1 Tax=Undibacterium sp. Jales W-56 TaxID=2897325 RepID=UPI0021D13AD6|nr:ABC transporter permease [Undibacterium sp. Jales W-56]MCU6434878.1 ABC transporter permease [Undibacterium sp. Jales W-56]
MTTIPPDQTARQSLPEDTPLRRFVRQFFESKIATMGLVILVLILCAAIFAPFISPQNPYDLGNLDVMDSRLEPGQLSADGKLRFLMGTDEQGRDMLSAIIYGLRISVAVGVISTVIALLIGLSLGLFAGYAGGKTETLIMRIADIQLSFPPILIALILLALTGQGVGKIIIALVAVQWAYYARTARSAALVERKKEYIEAAAGLGLSPARIILRHLLPNCLPPLIVIAALQVASAISLEATLSFLGLGLPVTEPSLGLLIANGFQYLLSGKYWISFFPGIALLVTVVAINLVADQLRDVLNPRLQTQ